MAPITCLRSQVGYELCFNVEEIGPFVCEINGTTYIPGSCTAIGIKKDGVLKGGVLYCQYNGSSVWVHVASKGKWLTRDLIWHFFDYPFRQLKVNQILGSVDSNNAAAIKFDEHLGFERKAVIPQAGKDDSNLIIYSLTRESCRWWNEQTRYPARA